MTDRTPPARRRVSRVLIDESPLVLLPSLACAVGDREAVVIQQLHYVLQRGGNEVYEIDGRRWAYLSYAAWHEQHMPFWDAGTIRNRLRDLETLGLVLSTPQDGPDRPKGWSINYDRLDDLMAMPSSWRVKTVPHPVMRPGRSGRPAAGAAGQNGALVRRVDGVHQIQGVTKPNERRARALQGGGCIDFNARGGQISSPALKEEEKSVEERGNPEEAAAAQSGERVDPVLGSNAAAAVEKSGENPVEELATPAIEQDPLPGTDAAPASPLPAEDSTPATAACPGSSTTGGHLPAVAGADIAEDSQRVETDRAGVVALVDAGFDAGDAGQVIARTNASLAEVTTAIFRARRQQAAGTLKTGLRGWICAALARHDPPEPEPQPPPPPPAEAHAARVDAERVDRRRVSESWEAGRDESERSADAALATLPAEQYDQLAAEVLGREELSGLRLLARRKGVRNTRGLKLLMFERLRAGWTAARSAHEVHEGGKTQTHGGNP